MENISKKRKSHHLTPQQKRYILRAIAEYKQTAQIVQDLKERWTIEISPATIDHNYRYAPAFRTQILKYRNEFTEKEREHPLFNRQVLLNYLLEAMELALQDHDGKALAALINQAKDITGMGTPTELEVTHHNGAQTFEELLSRIVIVNP